ncbi:MAG TPA: hypothetical protein VKR31_03965 [Rhizomicrobium sp.]|nr:hypothetical protein [Rhizomicrobium sp.]
MMKTDDGGMVSPANGHHCTADMNCYREVFIVPDGTEIAIRAGMRIDP